jgi:hypothetical protein
MIANRSTAATASGYFVILRYIFDPRMRVNIGLSHLGGVQDIGRRWANNGCRIRDLSHRERRREDAIVAVTTVTPMELGDYFSIEAILADNQVRIHSFFHNTFIATP